MSRLKDPCACCIHRPLAAHTIAVHTHRPRPGVAGTAATACASLAVERPTSSRGLRCPAHPPGRGARRAPPTASRKKPCGAGALRLPLPPSGERRGVRTKGCVAQASCAETVCPPAAKTGAAQSEGRTVLSKPSARLVERARRERRAGLCGGTVPSATSVRAGGSLSPSVSHTVVAWRCLEDRTLTGAPHRV